MANQSEAKLFFFRATPALVLALVGAYWFSNQTGRDRERDTAIATMETMAASVKANSVRLTEHEIEIAILKDRAERDAQTPMVK